MSTAAVGSPAQVDGNAAAGIQPFGISGTSVTINETSIAAGFSIQTATCSNGVSTVGSLSGTIYTIPAASMTGGTDFTCTFTNARVPIVKVQKSTTASVGGPFSFTAGNLASVPAAITTTVADTPQPPSPTAIAVTAINTAVTITESVAAGFVQTSVSCNDANSAVTGNSNPIASVAGTGGLTIPAAAVRAGADISCVFTNRVLVSDLSITKTNTPGVNGNFDQANDLLTAGASTTYSIIVTNGGPDPVTGAVVTDTVQAGLACTTVACTPAAGANCGAGPFTLGQLTGAGLTLGTMTSGSNVTITMQCTVQ